MSDIKTLVLMQLRDKMDLSWTKTARDRIRTIVLAIVKFLTLTALYTGVLYVLTLLRIVYYNDLPTVMTLVLSLVVLMLIVSNTIGLTESLYFSEDNRVLITLPVTNNKIFASKLLVFFFYELKRSFSFTIPIILGTMINIYLKNYVHFTSFLWCIIPILLMITIAVLLGAILSIPSLYVYRFISRYKIAKAALIVIGLGIYVAICLSLAKFLPKEINMVQQWPDVRLSIMRFLIYFEEYNPAIKHLTRMIIGEYSYTKNIYFINGYTFAKVGILLAICVALYIIVYFASRPIFFDMMSKNFEFNKDANLAKPNKVHSKFVSFNIKEAKVSFRSAQISLNFLLTYVTIPILVFFLNALFNAMDKSPFGVSLTYVFNVLVMMLPMLLSNSMIATLYSKEGRAGYMKKTKPVNPLLSLTSKLTFNLVWSIPSIITSVCIFANYINVTAGKMPEDVVPLSALQIIMFIFCILLVNYGHIFSCAKNDIMNPQNEKYATSGNDFINPNETRANISAGIITLIYTFMTFLFFNQTFIFKEGNVQDPLNRMLILSVIIFVIYTVSYILQIKAFYAQSQE